MMKSSSAFESDYEEEFLEEFPMAAITRISARIVTSDRPDAGTDGRVYLGIAGREFRLESARND